MKIIYTCMLGRRFSFEVRMYFLYCITKLKYLSVTFFKETYFAKTFEKLN